MEVIGGGVMMSTNDVWVLTLAGGSVKRRKGGGGGGCSRMEGQLDRGQRTSEWSSREVKKQEEAVGEAELFGGHQKRPCRMRVTRGLCA